MKKTNIKILMLAAECRGLAKVGGLGDVVLDLSLRLKNKGHDVSIFIPYYENLEIKASVILSFNVKFGKKNIPAKIMTCKHNGLTIYLLDSSFFQKEGGDIYVDSAKFNRGPFEDDAQRFAFFCAAIIELLKTTQMFSGTNILHCHDWQTGPIPLLLRLEGLEKNVRTVFTIHNLDYQGIRPMDDPYAPWASFRQWYPEYFDMLKNLTWRHLILDPRTTECFNPMRCGIRLSDGINTVSPTYAKEITMPDNISTNFIGGRGLETALKLRQKEGRLWGILNGLDYEISDPDKLSPPYNEKTADLLNIKKAHRENLLKDLPGTLQDLKKRIGKRFKNSDKAIKHLPVFLKSIDGKPLVVSITRAVNQKLGLFLEQLNEKKSMLEAFLEKELSLLIIGTGELEKELEKLNKFPNALFICAFDPNLAQNFYSAGNLFLMPSDFEPCGISQLIAMRYGCLPIVNDIGGLHDTVINGKSGFVFSGKSREEARTKFLNATDNALDIIRKPSAYEQLIRTAMSQRFNWDRSVEKYEEIYETLLRANPVPIE